MDRIFENKYNPLMIETVKYGELDSVPIDQQSARDFNIDPTTGFPMDDITAILRSSQLEARMTLADLQEFKADFLPADMSDDDALKYYQPKFCQLPSELAELSERITKERFEEWKRDNQRQQDEEEENLYKEFLEDYKKKKSVESIES